MPDLRQFASGLGLANGGIGGGEAKAVMDVVSSLETKGSPDQSAARGIYRIKIVASPPR